MRAGPNCGRSLSARLDRSTRSCRAKLRDAPGANADRLASAPSAGDPCFDHLAALEWASRSEKLELPSAAVEKMQQMMVQPPEPGKRLRAAAKRHGR